MFIASLVLGSFLFLALEMCNLIRILQNDNGRPKPLDFSSMNTKNMKKLTALIEEIST